jgi:hypothetical protein
MLKMLSNICSDITPFSPFKVTRRFGGTGLASFLLHAVLFLGLIFVSEN